LQDDEEYISLENGTESPRPPEDEGGEGEGGQRRIKRLDGRTAKRRKFLEDYEYLNKDIISTSTNLASAGTGTKSFPYEPSSVRPPPSFHKFLV
jgi:hypothetical protein